MLTGERFWTISQAHQRLINNVSISPDGNLIASAGDDKMVRLWSVQNGDGIRELRGHTGHVWQIRWSSDGNRLISSSGGREYDKTLRLWDIHNADCLNVLSQRHANSILSVEWLSDDQYIISADITGIVQLWDGKTGDYLQQINVPEGFIHGMRLSPDGRLLLITYEDGSIVLFDPYEEQVMFRCQGHGSGGYGSDWSSDGRYFVTAALEEKIQIWDANTGGEVGQFCFSGMNCIGITWSPNDDYLISAHRGNVIRFWDLWAVLPEYRPAETVFALPEVTAHLPAELRILPDALTQLHRLGIYPPLSLVQNLLKLTEGEKTQTPLDSLLETSRSELDAVIRLRWSSRARVGIVTLLLQGCPLSGWQPPSDGDLREIREALKVALTGEVVAPDTPGVPLTFLQESMQRLDQRMVLLLRLLGAETIAEEPGLVLQMSHKVGALPILGAKEQKLLGLRIDFSGREGQSTGYVSGSTRREMGDMERGQRNEWNSLLPSQFALPRTLFAYKFSRGELLYRNRRMADPPQQRPVVLLLDVSPPVQSTVERITRPAAFAVMQSLQQSGVPIYLVTTGENEEIVLPLRHVQEGLEIWTKRTWQIANVTKKLGNG